MKKETMHTGSSDSDPRNRALQISYALLRLEKTLYHMFHSIPVEEGTLAEIMQQLGHGSDCFYGYLFVQSTQEKADFAYFERALSQVLGNQIREEAAAYRFTLTQTLIGVMVIGPMPLLLSNQAKAVQRELKQRHRLQVSIVLSEECTSIADLPGIFEQSRYRLLQIRPLANGDIIASVQELGLESEFPALVLEKLLRSIYSNNVKEFQAALQDLHRHFSGANITIGEIKTIMIILFGGILHTAFAEGVDVSNIDIRKNLSYVVAESYSWDLLRETFRGFCLEIMNRIDMQHNDATAQIVQYVTLNFEKPLSLNSLAATFNFSGSYISTSFKQHTGKTFRSYLTNLRMERAKTLLKDEALKIHRVSRLVGYDDQGYFTKQFKRHTGMLPSSYRKSCAGLSARTNTIHTSKT